MRMQYMLLGNNTAAGVLPFTKAQTPLVRSAVYNLLCTRVILACNITQIVYH